MNLVVIVADWLALLDARAHGQRWSAPLGKVERPPLRTVPREHTEFRSVLVSALPGGGRPPDLLYLVYHGRVRASVELTALRNGVDGWHLDVDSLLSVRPVTIHQLVRSWWRGWKETWWKDWPAEETREGVHGDEVSFVAWATAGLPAELQAEAEALSRRVTRRAPPTPDRLRAAPAPVLAAAPSAPAPSAPALPALAPLAPVPARSSSATRKEPASIEDQQVSLWGFR
jgi:hypothetical protein